MHSEEMMFLTWNKCSFFHLYYSFYLYTEDSFRWRPQQWGSKAGISTTQGFSPQTRNHKERLQTCSPEQSIPFIVTMDSTLGLADLFLCSNLTAKCVTLMLSSLSLSLPVLLVHRQKVFQFMKCDLNRNVHWKLGAAPQSCWHSDRDFNESFMFDLWDPSAQKAHCFSQECGKAACV